MVLGGALLSGSDGLRAPYARLTLQSVFFSRAALGFPRRGIRDRSAWYAVHSLRNSSRILRLVLPGAPRVSRE
jgi:hypothetical protein